MPGFFTAANAAQYARKSHAPESARFRKPPPEAPALPPEQPVSNPAALLDEFAARRLMRVREQLQRLDDLAAQATDSKVLKELADATTRLAEQERILAGRPLPGSRRPAAEPKRGRPESVGPWVPAVVQPMVPAISPTQPTEPPTGQQADK